MNFLSFDYFLALARERSYTRAADVLHITQQSLSAAIAALERELGRVAVGIRHAICLRIRKAHRSWCGACRWN